MSSGGASTDAFPVWADGRLRAPGTPVVSAEDQGFLLGLSVFDSLLLEDGCLYFLEEHLARLRRGGAELGIAWPPPWDPAEALRAVADAVGRRDCVLRVTQTRGVPGAGASLIVTGRPLAIPPPPGVVVFVSTHRKLAGDLLEGVKSTNRLRNVLAREEAQAHGAWEALLLNHDGDVSEGTISNLFVVAAGELCTPSTDRGCLAGIVRDKLLQTLGEAPLRLAGGRTVPVRVGRVEEAELAAADEVFLTNTSGRVLPVVAVRGLPGDAATRALPGSAGPVARAVRERVAALEAAYRAAAR